MPLTGDKKIKNPQRKFHVKTGDKVVVISGKNKGKTGTVIKVLRDKERVLLDGEAAIFTTKHQKPDPQNQVEGGRIPHQRPIHVSNVALWDEAANKTVRRRSDLSKS